MSFHARLFLLSVPLFVGCSSSSSGGSTSGAADPTPPDDSFDVSYFAAANGGSERIVQANFEYGWSGLQCTNETVAGCTVSTCSPANEPLFALDPGALSVSNATLGQQSVVLDANGFGRIVQAGMWNAGESVELKGTGGADIPGFDVTTTIPPMLSGIAFDGCSSTEANAPCTLSSGGSVVTWSGGAGASVTVRLSPSLDTPPKVSAACRYPGDGGAGRIPAEVVAKLSPGAAYVPYITSQIGVDTIVKGAKYSAAVGARRIFMGTAVKLKTPS